MGKIENQIHFEQLGLGNVLKRYQLIVPPNQREYSWKEREITTLLQDFAQAIADDESGYFLGTVVTIPQKTGVLEVVDGQQRLATTAILLRCVFEYLLPHDAEFANSIVSDFLSGYDRDRRQHTPHLALNLSDNDFFRARITGDLVLPDPLRPSHFRMELAFEKCREHVRNVVSSYAERDHVDVLNRWVKFIRDKALVILVQVSDDANAYKMFEALNDRGLKISQSDLVKNHLFGTAAERIGEVQEKWSMLKGALEAMENEDITMDFLRHALIATHGLVRENHVYQTVQTIAKSPQSAVTFANNMEVLANIYVAIHNPEHEKWNKYPDSVRRCIEVLNLFNIKPMRPLILSIASKFSEKDAAQAFSFLISLAVRVLICGTSRNLTVEQAFASTANEIYKGTLSSDFATSLKNVTPTDEHFAFEFERASVSKMQYARYYLRSLEMTAKGEKEPWLIPNDDKQTINLEHILPRKPENNWPQFNADDVYVYVNRLGNLALLQASQNSNLKTNRFEDKKVVYALSPYVLTKQIADADKWDKDSIIERQKVLASIAVKAWKV